MPAAALSEVGEVRLRLFLPRAILRTPPREVRATPNSVLGAVLYGMFSGAGGGFRAGPGPAGEVAFQTGMYGGGLAGSLMKIAVILILAGLALLFVCRLAPRSTSHEDVPNENQP